MVRTVNATRVSQDILERIAEHAMSFVDGDDLKLGKIRGLEEALTIIGWIIHPEGRGWSSLFKE